jgi:hypothetical protein
VRRFFAGAGILTLAPLGIFALTGSDLAREHPLLVEVQEIARTVETTG